MKEELSHQKLRLFESSLPHMWIEWHSDDSIKVISSSGENLLPMGDYLLSSLVSKEEQVSLKAFKDRLDVNISKCQFIIQFGGKKTAIQCSAQKSMNKVYCLWIVSENSQSVGLLQNAAHDFRTPLGSILGFVNLMKNMLQSGEQIDMESVGLYLDMMKLSADKALDLSSEIMELAEIESASYKLSVEKVVLADFVKRYLETHRLITFKKNIKVDFQNNSNSSVLINELKLTRVFDNVMSNAVKFSKKGGIITVTLKEDGDAISVIIKDQGIGMSKEILSLLFEKFSKAKRRGLDGEPSHGLGMSIVRQIMLLHDGGVHVTSEEGVGTEVHLNFKTIK